MGFQSVRDLDVKGHRVFLRADLNVPLKEGKISLSVRRSDKGDASERPVPQLLFSQRPVPREQGCRPPSPV